MRDDFTIATKDILAKRVGYRCSNPGCRKSTSGPQEEPSGTINLGVAAHITAASKGGPRFDPNISEEERKSVSNGIWLCQSCAKLVDNDPKRYTVELLQSWKISSEDLALQNLENPSNQTYDLPTFERIERLMPDLVEEMRDDLNEYPLRREFVILKKSWSYWAKGNELAYYYDDHPELNSKINILKNSNLIREITYNNTDRFLMTEQFVEFLIGPQ